MSLRLANTTCDNVIVDFGKCKECGGALMPIIVGIFINPEINQEQNIMHKCVNCGKLEI